MATYEVTSPDGKVYELEGPSGATQEEVLFQAQRLIAEGKLEEAKPDVPRNYKDPLDKPNAIMQFLGSKSNLGKRIGAELARFSPEAKALQESQANRDRLAAMLGQQTNTEAENRAIFRGGEVSNEKVVDEGVSNLQAAGSAANTLLALAGPLGLAKAIPVATGKGALNAANLANVGKSALQGATLSGLAGSASAVSRGETDAKKIFGSGALGAAIGAVINPAVTAGMDALQRRALQGAANKYNSVLFDKADLRRAAKEGRTTLGEKIVERGGIKGLNLNTIRDNADDAIRDLNKKYGPILSQVDDQKIDLKSIGQQLLKEADEVDTVAGPIGKQYSNQLRSQADFLLSKGSVTPATAQQTKVSISKRLGDKFFAKAFADNPASKQAAERVRDSIDDALSAASPDLRALNTEQSFHRSVKRVVEEAIAKNRVLDVQSLGKQVAQVLAPGKLFTDAGIGAVAGLLSGNPIFGAGAALANRALTSVPGRLVGARASQDLSQFLGSNTSLPLLASVLGGQRGTQTE